MALWSAGIYDYEAKPYDDGHPTRAEMVELYREVARVAPIASGWAGYEIPPWLALVSAHYELHNHNNRHNCCGGDPGALGPHGEVLGPNDRSAGYFGIGAPAVERFGSRLGFGVPRRATYRDRNEWTKATCRWLVAHPVESVSIYFALVAYHLRENAGGNLYRLWEIYKGPDGGKDYAWQARDIWRRRGFPWPPNGQLPRHR